MRHITRTRLIILILILIVGAYAYHRFALYRFEAAYRTYAALATRHDEAALIPMLPENPLRRDLNNALTAVLTNDLSADERLERAREGLVLLVLAEGNIDAVGDVGEDATAAVFALEEWVSPAALGAYPAQKALVELAHQRLSAVSDIRGLSYRANHDTKTIFERIIEDDGELTVAHGEALERQLPDVEEQYDRRSNLHLEVDSLAADIRRTFADIDSSW